MKRRRSPRRSPLRRSARRITVPRPNFESLELRLPLAGSVVGSVFEDLNRDGVRQTGEPAEVGRTVYLDLDGDGRLDDGEPSAATGSDGAYRVAAPSQGRYTVRLAPKAGSTLTNPFAPIDDGGTLVPITTPRDVIFDAKRNQMLVTDGEGKLNRYDLATETALPSWDVGLDLYGGDVAPDGAYAFVADSARTDAKAVVKRVDLETGAVRNIVFAAQEYRGAGDLKIVGGKALIALRSNYAGNNVRVLDLSTLAVDAPTVGIQRSYLQRSADRSVARTTDNGARPDKFTDYSPTGEASGSNISVETGYENYAVSPTGRLGAWVGDDRIDIRTSLGRILTSIPGRFGAAVFDPARSMLYATRLDTNQIVAVDLDTWTQRYALRIPAGFLNDEPAFRGGVLRISDDGDALFLVGGSGVRRYRLGSGGADVEAPLADDVAGPNFGATRTGYGAGEASPRFSVSNAGVVEGNTGGSRTMTFVVSLAAPLTHPAQVDYETYDLDAVAGSDYQAVDGTLTFAPGETSKSVVVRVAPDWAIEPTEQFMLFLINPVGAGLAADSVANGTIENDDAKGVFEFSSTKYEVDESAGYVDLVITRTGGLGGPVDVRIRNQWPLATDAVKIDRIVTFAGGETSRVVRVPIPHDPLATGPRKVGVAIMKDEYYFEDTADLIVADAEQSDFVQIRVDTARLIEGGPGVHTEWIDLSLAAPSRLRVSVNYRFDSYWSEDAPVFVKSSGTVVFEPGRTTARVPIDMIGDYDVDAPRELMVHLEGATNGWLVEFADDLVRRVDIVDDDAYGDVQFSKAVFGTTESAGRVVVELERTGGLAGNLAVKPILSDGTAVAGLHFGNAPDVVVFGSGESHVSFTVPILGDGVFGSDRVFTVGFSVESPGGYGARRSASVVVQNSDAPPRVAATSVTANVKAGSLSSLRLTFDGALDAASAAAPASYRLVPIDAKGKQGKPIVFASAVYDPGAKSVTLTLKKPLKLAAAHRLSVPGLLDSFKQTVLGRGGAAFAASLVPKKKAITVVY